MQRNAVITSSLQDPPMCNIWTKRQNLSSTLLWQLLFLSISRFLNPSEILLNSRFVSIDGKQMKFMINECRFHFAHNNVPC